MDELDNKANVGSKIKVNIGQTMLGGVQRQSFVTM